MALFKSKIPNQLTSLVSKSQLIETLLKSLEKDYSAWKVIEIDDEEDKVYDLLLIRNVKKVTTKYIRSKIPDPFHDGKEEIVQLVIAILFIPKSKIKDFDLKTSESLQSWTYKYIVTDSVKSVLSALEQIEEENLTV